LLEHVRVVRVYYCTQSFHELLDEGRRPRAPSRFVARLVVIFRIGAVVDVAVAVLQSISSPATGDDGGS
jgi:hypothetical protein